MTIELLKDILIQLDLLWRGFMFTWGAWIALRLMKAFGLEFLP